MSRRFRGWKPPPPHDYDKDHWEGGGRGGSSKSERINPVVDGLVTALDGNESTANILPKSANPAVISAKETGPRPLSRDNNRPTARETVDVRAVDVPGRWNRGDSERRFAAISLAVLVILRKQKQIKTAKRADLKTWLRVPWAKLDIDTRVLLQSNSVDMTLWNDVQSLLGDAHASDLDTTFLVYGNAEDRAHAQSDLYHASIGTGRTGDRTKQELPNKSTDDQYDHPISDYEQHQKNELSGKSVDSSNPWVGLNLPLDTWISTDASANAISPQQELTPRSAEIESIDSPVISNAKIDSHGRVKNSRACERCRHRKIRCTYQQPCASCSRFGVECIYASSDGKLLISSAYLQRLEHIVKDLERQSALQKTSRTFQDAATQTEGLQPGESWASDNTPGEPALTSPLRPKDQQVPKVPAIIEFEKLRPVSDTVDVVPDIRAPTDTALHYVRSPTRNSRNMSPNRALRIVQVLDNPTNAVYRYVQKLIGEPWNTMPRRIFRMLRPRVKPDHQRLEWICSCGKAMYGDYAAVEVDTSKSTLVRTLPHYKVVWDALQNRQQEDHVPQLSSGLIFLLCITYPAAAFSKGLAYNHFIESPTMVQLFARLSLTVFAIGATLSIYLKWSRSRSLRRRRHQTLLASTANFAVSEVDADSEQLTEASAVDTSLGNNSAQQSTTTTTHGVVPSAITNSNVNASNAGEPSVTQANTGSNVDKKQPTLTPSYFELCVNQGRTRTSLCEIQLTDIHSERIATDVELFARIRQEYDAFRRKSIAKLLYRPCDIEFVRFHVQRAGYRAGIMNRPLSIPPESEVKAKRYHYYECPIDPLPPIDKRTFFHFFWEHASHSKSSGCPAVDTLWFKRMPKKLGASILEQQIAGLQLGWGVHIIEGPNKPLLAWLATGIMVLSFAVSLSYDIGYKNKESGFAIGQWMVAVLGTALTAIYFHLEDRA